MLSEKFADFGALYDACTELRAALLAAREAASEAEWEALEEGPFAEILCAAMDVEWWVDKCEES
ncbi:MAG: hypothetical protein ACO20M_06065 [Methylophilaceae bacterium]